MSNQEPKFRPSLTASQITTLLELCKSCATLTPEVMDCIATLAPFAAKIQHNAITPAYTISGVPRLSIEQKLGFSPSPIAPAHLTPEQKRKAAYDKLCSPACRNMSVDELELAHQFRYDAGLMPPDEMIIFESGQHNPHLILSAGIRAVLIDTDSSLLDQESQVITPEDLPDSGQ